MLIYEYTNKGMLLDSTGKGEYKGHVIGGILMLTHTDKYN